MPAKKMTKQERTGLEAEKKTKKQKQKTTTKKKTRN